MKKLNLGHLVTSVGVLLLIVQLLILLFNMLNGTMPCTEFVQFAVENEITFMSVITEAWAGIVGTLLLIVLFIRRLVKGPDAMLVIVGALLWFVQIISLYDTSMVLQEFILSYIIGIFGTIITVISGLYDAYLMKKNMD